MPLGDSITVIVDAAEIPTRQDGRAAAEAVFLQLFPADLRAPANLPPAIQQIGLRAQDFGDVVIVSFHIHGSSQPAPPE